MAKTLKNLPAMSGGNTRAKTGAYSVELGSALSPSAGDLHFVAQRLLEIRLFPLVPSPRRVGRTAHRRLLYNLDMVTISSGPTPPLQVLENLLRH
jgi:hypothetical protein